MTVADFRQAAGDARKLPCSLEAEQALIGCVLFDNEAMQSIDGLEPWHFGEPVHQGIWAAIVAVIATGEPAEPIVIGEALSADPAFQELGGFRYLGDLVDKAPWPGSAPGIAKALMASALRRDLLTLARNITDAAYGAEDPFDTVATLEGEIADLAHGVAPGDANLVDARSSAEATLAQMRQETEEGRAKGKMTGLRCFDWRLRGLRPGHLIVIGGRPSMAKTGLARAAAMGCASRNPHDLVAFFALEMDRRELDERTLSQLSFEAGDGIAYQDMSSGKLGQDQLKTLDDLVWKVPENFIIDDSSSLTVDYIKRRVWALKRRGNVCAVFIDYLQIMDLPERNGRNDAALIGSITKELKNLARAANVCVVLLSQINRGVEQREDKKPMLSDLRESGAIEQDANSVLFPFREVYYLQRAEPRKDSQEHRDWETEVEIVRRKMEVICAKNRGGAIGTDEQEYFTEFDVIRDGGR